MRAAIIVLLVPVLAALAFSCGSEAPVCGPDNCTGCCSEAGDCLPYASQSKGSCGAEGAACKPCHVAGFTCSERGTCVPDDEQPLECNADTCVGCCDGVNCLPYLEQNESACGAIGQACASCLGGAQCIQGACTILEPKDAGTCGAQGEGCCPSFMCDAGLQCLFGVCQPEATQDAGHDAGTPDAGMQDAGTPDAGSGGTLPIGEPCTQSAQCASNVCRIINFPGGYCTRTCTTNAECGAGATCGTDPANASARICLKTCAEAGTTSGCRPDYVCEKRAHPNGTPACVPGCTSQVSCSGASACDSRGFCCGLSGFACCEGSTCTEAGTGCGTDGYCEPMAGGVGAACTGNGDCQTGFCQQQTSGLWTGGYCTLQCGAQSCPSGSVCSTGFSTAICLDACAQAGSQSDCRPGYVCDLGWGPGATCVYACTSSSQCGSNVSCQGGFCCGQVSYRCCGGVGGSCPHGGTCGANGYCQ